MNLFFFYWCHHIKSPKTWKTNVNKYIVKFYVLAKKTHHEIRSHFCSLCHCFCRCRQCSRWWRHLWTQEFCPQPLQQFGKCWWLHRLPNWEMPSHCFEGWHWMPWNPGMHWQLWMQQPLINQSTAQLTRNMRMPWKIPSSKKN